MVDPLLKKKLKRADCVMSLFCVMYLDIFFSFVFKQWLFVVYDDIIHC